MLSPGTAQRLTVFVGQGDTWNGRPLYAEIVHRALRAGLAGASVLEGIQGFGSSRRIRSRRLLSVSSGVPLVIVIIDRAEKIRDFLPVLGELLGGGLAVLDPVEVVGI